MIINVQFDQNKLRKIAHGFDPDVIATAVYRAINKAAAQGNTAAKKAVRAEYTLPAAVINENVYVRKATKARPTAEIVISSTRLSLSTVYKAKQNKKGVRVQIKRSKGKSVILHAFVTTMRSGHEGVFIRATANEAERKLVARLPISELTGPTVPSLYGAPVPAKALEAVLSTKLYDIFEHELWYEYDRRTAASKAAGAR
jgi:hypothetical protein